MKIQVKKEDIIKVYDRCGNKEDLRFYVDIVQFKEGKEIYLKFGLIRLDNLYKHDILTIGAGVGYHCNFWELWEDTKINAKARNKLQEYVSTTDINYFDIQGLTLCGKYYNYLTFNIDIEVVGKGNLTRHTIIDQKDDSIIDLLCDKSYLKDAM
jgi:hypothetical protein